MKKKYLWIVVILLFIVGIFLYVKYFSHHINLQASNVIYDNDEIVIDASKSYTYRYSVNDNSIASFKTGELNGTNVKNNLIVHKTGNVEISVDVYDGNQLIETLKKQIQTCGDVFNEYQIQDEYQLKIGEEISLFSLNNECTKDLRVNTSDESIMKTVGSNRLLGIGKGEAYASISHSGKNYSKAIIVKVQDDNEPIELISNYVSIVVDEQFDLATLLTTSNEKIVWESENNDIVEINNGIALGKQKGITNVLAKIDNQVVASCEIEVQEVTKPIEEDKTNHVAYIYLTPNRINLRVGEELKLGVSILPGDATNQNVTWSSSNPSVVSVNNGVIKTLAPGTATIEVKSEDGGKVATAIVNVVSNQTPSTTPTVSVTGVTLSPTTINLEVGSYSVVTATILPSNATNKGFSFASSNPNVATVSSSGVVTGVGVGNTLIYVTTTDGHKQAFTNVNVISKSSGGGGSSTPTTNPYSGGSSNYIGPTTEKVYAKYESNTLKYWIEKKGTYALTHVWVQDAYNQFKTAIPNGKLGSLANASTILSREISSKGYSKKGLVAFNASAFVGGGHNSEYSKAVSAYNNSSVSPIVILDGKVLRNLTNKEIPNLNRKTYGLTRSGYLASYSYSSSIASNQSVAQQIINDGVRYTFSFTPVLIYGGGITTSSTSTNNMRQALCQIDHNNFAIYTSISSSDAPTHYDVAQILQGLGCQTAFALDGSGSVSGYYKTNTSSTHTLRSSSRSVADIIYFVEQ